MRRGLLGCAAALLILAACTSTSDDAGRPTTTAPTATTLRSRTATTTAVGTVRITTRPVIAGPRDLAVRITGWTGATAAWPQGIFEQLPITGCRRVRVLGAWHLVSSLGEALTHPEVDVILETATNRFGAIEWTDRGSGDGTSVPSLRVGTRLTATSPWFDVTSPDPITVKLTMGSGLTRGEPHVDDRWRIDRLDVECEESA